jgi:hypothetical protein
VKSELEINCTQVRGFHRGVRKFIAKIQITFPSCADINLSLHAYLFPSQTELKVIGQPSDITIHISDPKLKVIENFVRRLIL